MTSLAEKLAEKKRLAALAANAGSAPAAAQDTVVTGTEGPTPSQAADLAATQSPPNLAVAIQNEITTDANGKPLSGFALIQARKKAAALAASQNAGDTGIQSTPVEVQKVQAETVESAVGMEETIAEVPEVGAEHEEAVETATPETRQAYADLKVRLDSLVSASGENLKNDMQELKRALMQNPNAVALMLPSDIGQMVIALRKMTGVELAAAKTTSTRVKKVKEVALTAEQLEAAWEEL